MLVHPSSIDLSSRALRYLTGQLAGRRREIGTRWRRQAAGRQALLALAHRRCGDTYAQLAAGFSIGIATVYRYIREAVEVLTTLAPTLAEAMTTARTKAFVILDGTLLPIDRIAADTPYYSGKHKRHGMNVQVLADPFGRLLWALTSAITSWPTGGTFRCRGVNSTHPAEWPGLSDREHDLALEMPSGSAFVSGSRVRELEHTVDRDSDRFCVE